MTGVADQRFPKSLIQADRIVTDTRWDLAEYGSTPFSDFFGLAMLSAAAPRAGLTARATPLSSAIKLPTIWHRRLKMRLRTGKRILPIPTVSRRRSKTRLATGRVIPIG
ncbi:hypothetical protein [Rhodovulum adriaticum]|uniref:Uncharacterized protein n=1 Tax=Rhodovulum adriaticum TaxID=35804 RepID=A0A4V2SM14_RHOAD|nr:hypothetical protein [Rhodovulum adriaticum]MBK1636901.1 hypothetical protein [Rhodovulum adriaticum]TCP25456.1 hypothetical protein EV656_103208 [Rhodovulum adriaticum]